MIVRYSLDAESELEAVDGQRALPNDETEGLDEEIPALLLMAAGFPGVLEDLWRQDGEATSIGAVTRRFVTDHLN